MDETGITTVHKPWKVLAPKETRHLGKLTSVELGTNTTMIACINAIGNAVPPMFVFPRVFSRNICIQLVQHQSKGGQQSQYFECFWITFFSS